ncbi:MAG: hypothetical protein ACRES7_11960 [Gammaproteobacteria bacterium]
MFVDLDRTHPIESMQIVIPQRDLSQFDPSPASWEGKRICVTGSVQNYRGRPEIVAYGPRPDPALPALRPLLCHEKETHLFFPGNLVVKQST